MSGIIGELPNDGFPADQIDDPVDFLEEPMDAILEIKEISVDRNPNRNNAVFYKILFTVVEPTACLSAPHMERFYVGSEDDPDHTAAETWNRMGGRMLKSCLKASKVPLTGGLSKIFTSAIGTRCGAQLRWEKPQDGYDSRIKVRAYKPLTDEKGRAFAPKMVAQERPTSSSATPMGGPPTPPSTSAPPAPPAPPKAPPKS